MSKDDRFSGKGTGSDSDMTQLFPMPGGNKDHIQTLLKNENKERQQQLDTLNNDKSARKEVNKKLNNATLVDVASPLLILVAHVANTLEARDTQQLRQLVIEEIDLFIKKTKQLKTDEQTRKDAIYVLCTAIDEAVLNTPWGSQSDWSADTLLNRYFKNVVGGDRLFFEKLLELGNDPGRHYELLKLMHYSLSLGYQGIYYTKPNADKKLAKAREWVAEKILQVEDSHTVALSPHWKGISGLGFNLKAYATNWLLGFVAALLLVGTFTYFFTRLNISTAAVNSQLVQLEVTAANRIEPKQTYEPEQTSQQSRIKDFTGQGIIVKSDSKLLIPVDDLFVSENSTKVTDTLRASLEQLGKMLKEEQGYFRITGHSDNVPLTFRAKQLYGSPQGLSQRRADAVAAILKPYLNDTSHIETKGKGNSEPIADNDSELNRSKNRRVEIDIFK